MQAQDTPLIRLLDGAKQFIVPIFQRDYSWGTRHCLRLWDDVIRAGGDFGMRAHFLGSIVHIAAEDSHPGVPRWLLIDGQQRLTTVALLLIALRDHLISMPGSEENLPSPEEINVRFLRNPFAKDDRQHKLMLRRADHEALTALTLGRPPSGAAAEAMRENYGFFRDRLGDADLGRLYAGIEKLVIVNVVLARGTDDPQMIFESLNSTGLDLTQADLIRNYILMGLDEERQTKLYEEYWRPIEIAFDNRYRTEFDKFCRDFLVLKLKPSKQLRADAIYQQFQDYFRTATAKQPVEQLLAELKRFAGYYVRFSLGQETAPALSAPAHRLRALVEVASPLMLRLYDCHERTTTFDTDAFREAIELLESYVFRRSTCDMQTRSLYQIFASLAYKIRDDAPLVSLKVALHRSGAKRRFPSDVEFRDALETRDIYAMRSCFYLLDRLENNSRERIDTSGFTIEHVLPQGANLPAAWREMLGQDWKVLRETWLHRLGNLTLTGYNPEYSNRSFPEKKEIANGFNDSPLRLNRFIREQERWTAAEIEARGKQLAQQAVTLWPALEVDMAEVRKAELEELRAAAAKYSIDHVFGSESAESRALFEAVRPHILALGPDVLELCNDRSIVYRVHDHFLEIIPRAKHIALVANIEFNETDDPSGVARDATEWAYITNASEPGGVIFSLKDVSEAQAAMHVVTQAYERVTE
jgi:predicted transport protein